MVNISSHVLSDVDVFALSKGLTFCPIVNVDWLQLELDLCKFYHNIKLKVMFGDRNIEPFKIRTSEISFHDMGLCKTSQFTPAITVSAVDTFMLAVRNCISKIRQSSDSGTISHNMTIAESSAIKTLTQDETLTIKLAVKGGTIVVMNSLQYIQEIQRQLNDCNAYDRP